MFSVNHVLQIVQYCIEMIPEEAWLYVDIAVKCFKCTGSDPHVNQKGPAHLWILKKRWSLTDWQVF